MDTKGKKISHKLATGITGSIEKGGKLVGGILNYLNTSEIYNLLAERFGINWFFNRVVSVDIEKTRKQVEKFRTKYPDDTPEKLVDRLTKHKAFYTATIGFTSGLVPGNIPALLFDFVTTIGAQAELIYEIALVYGMDLEDETRKGEVLTLIALGAGSTKTAEATLKLAMDISSKKMGSLLAEKMIRAFSVVVGEKIAKRFFAKMIPVLGGVIGATLNASMIMLTGRGAKAYYEAVINKQLVFAGTLPEELRQIYNKKDLHPRIKTEIRDLLIIRILIYLLYQANYTTEYIQQTIFEQYPEVRNDPQIEEYVINEINNSSYSEELIDKLDRPAASIVITKSILVITSSGDLTDFHREFLRNIAQKFDIPFETFSLEKPVSTEYIDISDDSKQNKDNSDFIEPS
jgi:uncharacterized protein (DUF697 family)